MRIWRWRLAITAVRAVKPELEFLLGTLAKLDERLHEADQQYKQMAIAHQDTTLHDLPSLIDTFGESYLWVLGSYEAIRTIAQQLCKPVASGATCYQSVNNLKKKFERLRVPLAKIEASRSHALTDYTFPKPGLHGDHGIAWEVAPGTHISRSELSDEFLAILEALQNGSLSA